MRDTPSRRAKPKAPGKAPGKASKAKAAIASNAARNAKAINSESTRTKGAQRITNILEARRKQEEADTVALAKEQRLARQRELLDDPWEIFLEAIRRLPDRGSALNAAGLGRKELSERLRQDPDFEKQFKHAFDDGLDSMEDEVVKRAVLGVDEPVFQGGLLVGHKTRYSDTLLMFFLEASRKKFRSGDAELRRPLSDEAKASLRQVFQDVVDEAETFAPPTAAPAAKRRGRKPKGEE